MPGMHGTKYANMTIYDSDLIIALGVRFDDRVAGNMARFAPQARVVHVDIDPAEIGKRAAVDVPIVGDLKKVLGTVTERGVRTNGRRSRWLDKNSLLETATPGFPISRTERSSNPSTSSKP